MRGCEHRLGQVNIHAPSSLRVPSKSAEDVRAWWSGKHGVSQILNPGRFVSSLSANDGCIRTMAHLRRVKVSFLLTYFREITHHGFCHSPTYPRTSSSAEQHLSFEKVGLEYACGLHNRLDIWLWRHLGRFPSVQGYEWAQQRGMWWSMVE